MSTMGLACARIFSIRIEEETAHTRDLSIKGNNMKNKKMAVAGISLLGSIGVISTGFAGWIIAAAPVDNKGTGSITADGSVTSKSVTLVKEECKFDDPTIRYAPNKEKAGNDWLTATVDAKNPVKLTTNYTLKFKFAWVSTITVSKILIADVSDPAKYQPLLTSKYVGELPALKSTIATNRSGIKATVTGKEVTVAENSISIPVDNLATEAELSVKFEIHFGWGEKFEYQNPMDYYGGKDKATYAAEAKTAIEALDNLNGASFKLSYTVSAN